MSRDAAKRRWVRPETETAYTDEEIHQGWAKLRREVRSELRTVEGLIRRREQGLLMSPDRVRYLLRRRRELREAMQLFSGQDRSEGVASLGREMRHPPIKPATPAGRLSGRTPARSPGVLEDHSGDGPGGIAQDACMAPPIRR